MVQSWCCYFADENKDFVRGMITKSIRLGADAKLINKCLPNLIPVFDVQLGTSIEKVKLSGNAWISILRSLGCTIEEVCVSNEEMEKYIVCQ